MSSLHTDLIPLAQGTLIFAWAGVFLGALALGSVAPALARGVPALRAHYPRLRRACRLAAFGVCMLGWVLVPDTFAVESRSEGAIVQVRCVPAEPGEWLCEDGSRPSASGPGSSGQEAVLHRLAVSGLRVHFELAPWAGRGAE
jgi:hypothetical protein